MFKTMLRSGWMAGVVLMALVCPAQGQRGAVLSPRTVNDVRERQKQLRARQLAAEEAGARRQELEKLDDLEGKYWKLWKENLNTDLLERSGPTRPSAKGMQELMAVGRALYEEYDKRVREGEEALRRAGKDPERDMDAGQRSLRAQRDMFEWTVYRPPQPPPVRWMTEAQIRQLPENVQERYRRMKREIGSPLPLPAPETIIVGGERHTKQEVLDTIRGNSRGEIQQQFDMMSEQLQQALNVPAPPPGSSVNPDVLARIADQTLQVNAEMVKSMRFWLAVLSEQLLAQRQPREIDADVDALLKDAGKFVKEADKLLKEGKEPAK
jgi:hypothetical protein